MDGGTIAIPPQTVIPSFGAAFVTDIDLLNGPIRDVLDAERKLCNHLDRIPARYDLKNNRKDDSVSYDTLIFGASEYVKDGLGDRIEKHYSYHMGIVNRDKYFRIQPNTVAVDPFFKDWFTSMAPPEFDNLYMNILKDILNSKK